MNPSVVRGLDHAATSFRGAGSGAGEPAADAESLAAVYRGRFGSQSPREPLLIQFGMSRINPRRSRICDTATLPTFPRMWFGSGGGDCINVLALSGGPGYNRGGNDGPRAGIVGRAVRESVGEHLWDTGTGPLRVSAYFCHCPMVAAKG